MNRLEFMKELECLLSDISYSEREEALQYYNDYFNDAGIENEDEVIASLDSPKKVAATIKAGLSGETEGTFTENGYQDYEEEQKNSLTEWKEYVKEEENVEENLQTVQNPPAEKKKHSTGAWIIILLLCLLFSPVILSVGIGFFATLFGIIVSILAVIFSLLVAVASIALALLITGVVLIGVGFVKMFVSPLGGTLLMAGGAVCLGLALLFVVLTVWVVGKVIPAVIRFIVGIFTRLFHKKGGATA